MTAPNNVVTESRALALLSAASLIALILLCAAWELWLAPVRPGGSWLALKALLLAWPLPGVLRKNRYTMQWASMFILLFFTEGIVRATSDVGLSRSVAVRRAGTRARGAAVVRGGVRVGVGTAKIQVITRTS